MKASRQNLLYIGGGIIAFCLIYLFFFRSKPTEGFANIDVPGGIENIHKNIPDVNDSVVDSIITAIDKIAKNKPEYVEAASKIYNNPKVKSAISKIMSPTTAAPAAAPAPSAAEAPAPSAAEAPASAAAALPEPAITETPPEAPDSNYFDDEETPY